MTLRNTSAIVITITTPGWVLGAYPEGLLVAIHRLDVVVEQFVANALRVQRRRVGGVELQHLLEDLQQPIEERTWQQEAVGSVLFARWITQ